MDLGKSWTKRLCKNPERKIEQCSQFDRGKEDAGISRLAFKKSLCYNEHKIEKEVGRIMKRVKTSLTESELSEKVASGEVMYCGLGRYINTDTQERFDKIGSDIYALDEGAAGYIERQHINQEMERIKNMK